MDNNVSSDILKKTQCIELEILLFVHDVCNEYNLRYFLAGGTLLGAVRHKGFIPWDDDIDIAMPRIDYKKFIKVVCAMESKYKLETHENTSGYNLHFIKVINTKTKMCEIDHPELEGHGVFIDIFPLDGFGNDDKIALKNAKQVVLCKQLFRYMDFACGIEQNTGPFIKIAKRIANLMCVCVRLIFGKEWLFQDIEKQAQKNTFDESAWVGSVAGGRKDEKELFPREIYEEYILMDFEGHKLHGMKHYDEYLTRMYGDYMTLPPEEERVGSHILSVEFEQ